MSLFSDNAARAQKRAVEDAEYEAREAQLAADRARRRADEAVDYARSEMNALREANGMMSEEIDELHQIIAALRADIAALKQARQ